MSAKSIIARILRGYEACAVDVYRAFGASYSIGVVLSIYYLCWLVVGLFVGAYVYDQLEALTVALSFLLPFGIDAAFDLGLLAILLFLFSLAACTLARLIVRILVYLCFEMRLDVLFNLLLLLLFVSILIFLFSAFAPPVLTEILLRTVSGISAAATAMLGGLVWWLHYRYRKIGNPSGRKFDYDIGLAWSHFSDVRRTSFKFNRSNPC